MTSTGMVAVPAQSRKTFSPQAVVYFIPFETQFHLLLEAKLDVIVV